MWPTPRLVINLHSQHKFAMILWLSVPFYGWHHLMWPDIARQVTPETLERNEMIRWNIIRIKQTRSQLHFSSTLVQEVLNRESNLIWCGRAVTFSDFELACLLMNVRTFTTSTTRTSRCVLYSLKGKIQLIVYDLILSYLTRVSFLVCRLRCAMCRDHESRNPERVALPGQIVSEKSCPAMIRLAQGDIPRFVVECQYTPL